MSDTYALRRQRVLHRLRQTAPEAAALVVTSLSNVRYLTGFTGSNAVLLLGPDDVLLGTDARYEVQVGEQCPELPTVLDRCTLAAVCSRWAGQGPLGLESAHLSVADMRSLESAGLGPLVETADVVEGVRIVKDAHELAAIEEACRVSDAALGAILGSIRVGVSEREIARALESQMFAHGADEISFATIVAGGPHSAKPHHEPTDRPLAPGDLLLIDFGAAVRGYHADETRTFVIGAAADWQIEIHGIVAEAQAAGRRAAVAGADLRSVDAAAREIIDDAGYADFFGHGLGHGVGLDIHEAPFFSVRATGMLPADSPVTIEPGIYLPGRGGVRIEDTIWVGEGPSRPLTTSHRDLVALG